MFCIKIAVTLVSALIDQPIGTRQMTLAITHAWLDFNLVFTNQKTLQYWGSKTSTFQYYLLWLHASVETSALNKLLHPHVQSTSHYISRLPHSLCTALMDVMTPKTTLQCIKKTSLLLVWSLTHVTCTQVISIKLIYFCRV